LRPATPPADFDLEQAVTSLRKFRQRQPAGVALAHYGLLPDPMAMLEEAEEILRQWAEVATNAWREDRDIAEALEEAFAISPDQMPEEQRHRLETLNGIHSNAAGLRRWLETTTPAE
jgi:lysophospholipase L1-like esterase